MNLIKTVSLEADWQQSALTEAFDRSAYPQGTRATDVRAWLRAITDTAKEQNKKITRKFVKAIMCGDPKTTADGIFGNDPGWQLIADNIRDNAKKTGGKDADFAEVSAAEIQTVDALWKDYLKTVKDGAIKQYHKAVEAEEQHGGVPNLTDRQLLALGKKFKRGETSDVDVYDSVRKQLYDYLEQNYSVHLDSLSQKDFQKLKEMVEYIVENVYQRWASEEMEEIVKGAERFNDLDLSQIDVDDEPEVDMVPDEPSIDDFDDVDDQADLNLDDIDNDTLDAVEGPIEQFKDAVSMFVVTLNDKGISPEVQRELIQQIVDELMEEGLEPDVE